MVATFEPEGGHASEVEAFLDQNDAVVAKSASAWRFIRIRIGALAALVVLVICVAIVRMMPMPAQDQEVSADTSAISSKAEGTAGCHSLKQHSGLVNIITDTSDQTALYLDVTDLLSENGRAQVLAIGMLTRGTFQDAHGQVSTLHEPVDATEETLLELSLSADRSGVDVSRPQLKLRSSDTQMREALRLGAWGGWEGSLSRLTGDCIGTKDRIVIDGSSLVSTGFYLEGWKRRPTSFQIRGVRAFPDNVDITVEMIAKLDEASMLELDDKDVRPKAFTITFALARLPKRPMQPRAMDDRIGYFTVDYVDLGQHNEVYPQVVGLPHEAVDSTVSVIQRYNLRALPDEQLRVYVDLTVPERWRRSFKEGIEAWNAAFQPLGYGATGKPAIRAVLPSDDDWPQDYHAGDARFNTISWSVDVDEETYSLGVCKIDPRSGQILKSDIVMTTGWIHSWLGDFDRMTPNSTMLSHGYRREQLPPVVARSPQELEAIGVSMSAEKRQAIVNAGLRSVVMHEMGHILGLRHNFKGSLGVSTACTRTKACSNTQGLSASVMDYLPMNIPSGVDLESVDIFTPVIGIYDKLAIMYGYAEDPAGDLAIRENPFGPPLFLGPILAQAQTYGFCTDGDWKLGQDPLCETRDISSMPLEAYRDRLRFLASSLQTIPGAAVAPGASYTSIARQSAVIFEKIDSIGHKLIHWLGGFNTSHAHKPISEGNVALIGVAKPIPVNIQRQALTMLLHILSPFNSTLLSLEESISFLVGRIRTGVYGLGSWDLHGQVRDTQSKLLKRMMSLPQLLQILQAQQVGRELPMRDRSFSVGEFLQHLAAALWGLSDSPTRVAPGMEDINLQAQFVESLRDLASTKPGDIPMEILSEVLAVSMRLRDRIQDYLGSATSVVGPLDGPATHAYLLHTLQRLPNPFERNSTRDH